MNKINFDMCEIVELKEIKPYEDGNYVFKIVNKETKELEGLLIIPYKQPTASSFLDSEGVYESNAMWHIKVYDEK